MSYEYISPIDKGYKRFYLSRRLHNQLFPFHPTHWYRKYEYYWNERRISIHVFTNNWCVALETLCFPLNVLVNGLTNTKEIAETIFKLYRQKKCGSFHSYEIWRDTEVYPKVMSIVKAGDES